MNLQPAYATGVAVGVAGMIASEEKANKVSRTVESSAGIAFGQPAFRGSADHGVVLGATFAATSAGSAASDNAGAGTITASPTVTAGAKQGRYTALITSTGATADFELLDPDGLAVGTGNVGTAYSANGLAFTISDPGTDPNNGDRFFIDVTYTANTKFLGLTVLSAAVPANATTPDAYPQYATASVMTEGPMWVVAGASVVPGGLVYWDPATGRYSSDTTKIRIPNARFDTTAANGELVVVLVRKRDG